MANGFIEIKGIDNIKTQTELKKTMEDGSVVETQLITKISFQGEIDPGELARIHSLLKPGHEIEINIGAPQLSMPGLD